MVKILIILLGILLGTSTVLAKNTSAKTKKIRWIMAHNPTNSENNKLILEFAKAVNKKSKGKLVVKTSFLDNQTSDRHLVAQKSVRDGQAEISQVSLSSLRSIAGSVDIFNVPFLFKNHEQIKAVTQGEVGEQIKNEIFNATKNHGQLRTLAYTYSGGFFVMYGSKKIEKIEDFVKAKMLYSGEGPKYDFFEKLGVEFVDAGPASRQAAVELHVKQKIDLEQSELVRPYILSKDYSRYLKNIKYVYESNHAVYLTAIIINEKFMSGLSEEEKELLKSEVNVLAEKERILSIKQADDAKKYMMAKSTEFVVLPAPMLKQMDDIGQVVINEKYSHLKTLIEKVKGLKMTYAFAD